jgi:HEAT repeat protein
MQREQLRSDRRSSTMRLLIAFFTCAVLLNLADVSADVPKKEDIPKFIATLKSTAATKARVQAADDLGHRGAIRASDVEDAIDLLIGLLKKDKDADVRRACAKALGDIGSQADKCVEALKEALNDSNVNVKIAAMLALGQYGRDAKSAAPILKGFIKNKDDLKKATKDDKQASQAAQGALQSINQQMKK